MDFIYDMTKQIYEVLDDKKAIDIVVLSVVGISSIADYFVIASGTSSTHINALADHVEKALAKKSIHFRHKEGKALGGWLLLDYNDIVVHIFSQEIRNYYSLERIWSDAKRIEIQKNNVKHLKGDYRG